VEDVVTFSSSQHPKTPEMLQQPAQEAKLVVRRFAPLTDQ